MNTTVLGGGASGSIASKFLLENGVRCAPLVHTGDERAGATNNGSVHIARFLLPGGILSCRVSSATLSASAVVRDVLRHALGGLRQSLREKHLVAVDQSPPNEGT